MDGWNCKCEHFLQRQRKQRGVDPKGEGSYSYSTVRPTQIDMYFSIPRDFLFSAQIENFTLFPFERCNSLFLANYISLHCLPRPHFNPGEQTLSMGNWAWTMVVLNSLLYRLITTLSYFQYSTNIKLLALVV